MDCERARAAITALMDDRATDVDQKELEEHLAQCPRCGWPSALVTSGSRPSAPASTGPGGPTGPRTVPPVARRRRGRKLRRLKPGTSYLLGAVAMLVVAVIAGPFIYFHAVEGTPPAPLRLPVGPGGTVGPLNGTWTVAKPSQVQYRVEEVLFDQHHLAVGQTSKVSGTMVITGATVTAAHFQVDMGSMNSQSAGRDTVFRDAIMDTSSYPHGDFTLTRPVDMNTVPANGGTITEQATGKLELRGVSRPVTFPLTARRVASGIVVDATIPVAYRLWHIPNPSFAITRVANQGTIGLLLYFHHTR